MKSCKNNTLIISRSLDGNLKRKEKIQMLAHTLLCAKCRRYRAQMILIRQQLRRLK